MQITKNLVDSMAKPVLVVQPNGMISYINVHAQMMLRKLIHKDNIETIYEIEPDFDYSNICSETKKAIYFSNLKVNIDIFKAIYDYNLDVLIYIVDNILFNIEVDSILNSIEYVVNIVNADGAVEFFNDAGYSITGLSHEDTEPGHSLIEHYREKATCVTEPTFFGAIREKKSFIGRTTYKTGVTLLNKATPIFLNNGDVKRVLIIGQDVSENSALDEMIILSGNNSAPTVIRFNEINKYFSEEKYIVASETMKKIVNTAIKVSTSDSSVFIWGESGVGKEMIAKIIHYSSDRKDNPFITINCAAIPSELMESEFFGYEQGAFTSANRLGKKGLLEEADGGTVFLDELGELPYAMQSKLLRAIQENKIRKVGGNKDIPINVRYISATNLTAEQFLDNNVLRSDLYYRLGVIPINIPPLRKRRADIVPLVRHFLSYYNEQQSKTVVLSKKALRKLIDYDWPGNIRELKNMIERLVLLSDRELIDDIEMSGNFYLNDGGEYEDDKDQNIIVCNTVTMPEAYDEVFNSLVKKVYRENGSIVKTASILNINPSTIHRKIKQGKLTL